MGLNLYLNPQRFPVQIPREITSVFETSYYDTYDNYATFEGKYGLVKEMQLLNDKSVSFDGIDGKFSFEKNIITRRLKVLKISNGKANLVK